MAPRTIIGIIGDKIVKIGEIESDAKRVIDCEGLTVCPGFIDPHTHVDQTVLIDPEMEPYIRQGVTTIVTGNCGNSTAPQGDEVYFGQYQDIEFLKLAGAPEDSINQLSFDHDLAKAALKNRYGIDLDWKTLREFNEKCDQLPLGCNMAHLIGHGTLRTAVMGKDAFREATDEEIGEMKTLLKECLDDGAYGMSTGRDPFYKPGPYASDHEIHELLKTVSEYDGVFSSHTYNADPETGENDRIGGYHEMFRQAMGTGVKVNVSHVHVMGMSEKYGDGYLAAKETLDCFSEAKEKGIDLTYDVIPTPYASDFTMRSFGFFLRPLILREGTRKAVAEKLGSREYRDEVCRLIKEEGSMSYLDPDDPFTWLGELYILEHRDSSVIGRSFMDVSKKRDIDPLECLMDLFCEDPDMIADMTEEDQGDAVKLLIEQGNAMPCSDGTSTPKDHDLSGNDEIGTYPNAMNVGCKPRFLTKYWKNSFEKAVHQATQFPAERFGISDRGVLKEGCFADITIIDRDRLRSFDEEPDPLRDPEGISYVIVNGKVSLENGELTGNYSGKVLKKYNSSRFLQGKWYILRP